MCLKFHKKRLRKSGISTMRNVFRSVFNCTENETADERSEEKCHLFIQSRICKNLDLRRPLLSSLVFYSRRFILQMSRARAPLFFHRFFFDLGSLPSLSVSLVVWSATLKGKCRATQRRGRRGVVSSLNRDFGLELFQFLAWNFISAVISLLFPKSSHLELRGHLISLQQALVLGNGPLSKWLLWLWNKWSSFIFINRDKCNILYIIDKKANPKHQGKHFKCWGFVGPICHYVASYGVMHEWKIEKKRYIYSIDRIQWREGEKTITKFNSILDKPRLKEIEIKDFT